jgi:hypothetical protein
MLKESLNIDKLIIHPTFPIAFPIKEFHPTFLRIARGVIKEALQGFIITDELQIELNQVKEEYLLRVLNSIIPLFRSRKRDVKISFLLEDFSQGRVLKNFFSAYPFSTSFRSIDIRNIGERRSLWYRKDGVIWDLVITDKIDISRFLETLELVEKARIFIGNKFDVNSVKTFIQFLDLPIPSHLRSKIILDPCYLACEKKYCPSNISLVNVWSNGHVSGCLQGFTKKRQIAKLQHVFKKISLIRNDWEFIECPLRKMLTF